MPALNARRRAAALALLAVALAQALPAAEPPAGLVVVVPAGSLPAVADLVQGRAVVHVLAADEQQRRAWQDALAPIGGMACVEVAPRLERLPYGTRAVSRLRVLDWAQAAARGLSEREVLRALAADGVIEAAGLDAVALRAAAAAGGIPIAAAAGLWRRGREPGLAPARTNIVHDAGNRGIADDLLVARPEDYFSEARLDGGIRAEVSDRLPALWPLWCDGEGKARGAGDVGGAVAVGGVLVTLTRAEATAWRDGGERGPTWALVARDLASGVPLWSSSEPRALIGADELVALCLDERGLLALDLRTGARRWSGGAASAPRRGRDGGMSLVVAGTLATALADEVVVYATADGAVRWRTPARRATIAIHGDALVVGSAAGLGCHALADGALRWRWDAARLGDLRLQNAGGDGVVLASADAAVVVALADGAERLRTAWKPGPDRDANGIIPGLVAAEGGFLCLRERDRFRAIPIGGGPERELERTLLSRGFGFWSCNIGGTRSAGLLRYALGLVEAPAAAGAPWLGHMPAGGTCVVSSLIADHRVVTVPTGCSCGGMLGRPRGLVGLAAAPEDLPREAFGAPSELIRGPAWGAPRASEASPADWPCFRADPGRGSATAATPPPRPALAWRAPLGGTRPAGLVVDLSWDSRHHHLPRVSPPVAASGRVLVALPEQHAAVALDLATGAQLWRHRADAAIDSPPTMAMGRVFVGRRDGHVDALTVDAGALVWRRRVAPAERRMVQHGMLESFWPVIGSVTVVDGILHATAGWAGTVGIQHLAADADGAVVAYHQVPHGVYGNDVLVRDAAGALRLGVAVVDPAWKPGQPPTKGRKELVRWMPRLGVATGRYVDTPPHLLGVDAPIIDITRCHGRGLGPGKGVEGQRLQGTRALMLAGRRALHWAWRGDLTVAVEAMTTKEALAAAKFGSGDVVAWRRGDDAPRWRARPGTVWALAIGGDAVVVAGPAWEPPRDRMSGPGWLRVLDAASGAERGAVELPAAPVQDGVAIVDGAILASLVDGSVVCLR